MRVATFQMGRSENWFHWLLQVLPRIKQLVDSGASFDAIHAPNMQSTHRESLACAMRVLGVKARVIEDADPTADSIVEAPPIAWEPSDGSNPPRWIIEFLRSLSPLSEGHGDRIFISRRGFKGHDEAEGIERLLDFADFPIAYPAKMNFAEQVRRFSAAKMIIAPHGSGLTNVIFCRPRTRVVEIVPPDYHTNVFAKLCYSTGCFYTRVEAIGGMGR
jgi:capsular polysaccharide biosynthesis protein